MKEDIDKTFNQAINTFHEKMNENDIQAAQKAIITADFQLQARRAFGAHNIGVQTVSYIDAKICKLGLLLADSYMSEGKFIAAYPLYCNLQKVPYPQEQQEAQIKLKEAANAVEKQAQDLIIDASSNLNKKNAADKLKQVNYAKGMLKLIKRPDVLNEELIQATNRIYGFLWENARPLVIKKTKELLQTIEASAKVRSEDLEELTKILQIYEKNASHLNDGDQSAFTELKAKSIELQTKFKQQEDKRRQRNILKLIIKTQDEISAGDIRAAHEKLSEAKGYLDNIDQDNITPAFQETFAGKIALSPTNLLFLINVSRLFKDSLSILEEELKEFKVAENQKPQELAAQIIDDALWQHNHKLNKDTFYAPQYQELLNHVTIHIRNNWVKFNKRDNTDFVQKLVALITKNIKPIGWTKWWEDKSKTHSIASDYKVVRGQKEYYLPIFDKLPKFFEEYTPKGRPNIIIKLPILEDSGITSPILRTPGTMQFSARKKPTAQAANTSATVGTATPRVSFYS